MRNNYCFVVGNLGADPIERGRSEKSGAVVGFSVAENVQAFDSQSKTYKTLYTNWFHVTAFGSTAERVKKALHRGDRVAVQGRMKISKYTGKSGEEKTNFEIIADEVALWKSLPSSQGSGQNSGHNTNPQQQQGDFDQDEGSGAVEFNNSNEDDLPF